MSDANTYIPWHATKERGDGSEHPYCVRCDECTVCGGGCECVRDVIELTTEEFDRLARLA